MRSSDSNWLRSAGAVVVPLAGTGQELSCVEKTQEGLIKVQASDSLSGEAAKPPYGQADDTLQCKQRTE